MTVKECYEAMGADYEEVKQRLRTDERIARFVRKVPTDKSFELLRDSMDSRNMEEGFRAAHTIKGICQNLSLTDLGESASNLVERLRGGQEYGEDVEVLVDKVKKDYDRLVSCINELD